MNSSQWKCGLLFGLLLAISWLWLEKPAAIPASGIHSDTQSLQDPSGTGRPIPASVNDGKFLINGGEMTLHVFDRSPTDQGLLFSKTHDRSDEVPSSRDLWFRDASGGNRRVASDVVRASFSPDGKKFAYATDRSEVFIETLDGKRLAQLARCRDPIWRPDSLAVSLSVVASIDYPDYQQIVVYDVGLGRMTYSPGAE